MRLNLTSKIPSQLISVNIKKFVLIFIFISLIAIAGFLIWQHFIAQRYEQNHSANKASQNPDTAKILGVEYNSQSACPKNYMLIPGDPLYGTKDFCVMKYEAKCASTSDTNTGLAGGLGDSGDGSYMDSWIPCTAANSRTVVSVASGYPIAFISQPDAIARCATSGSNYHLITNDEWMTIARNVEKLGSNWYGGVPGTNFMFSGHSDAFPQGGLIASTDDNNGYFGTGDSATTCDGHYVGFGYSNNSFDANTDTPYGRACVGQRRTLYLSNGGVIWDLADNVEEWTSNTMECSDAACTNEMPKPSSFYWQEFTDLTSYGSLSYNKIRPSNSSWNSKQGVGKSLNVPDYTWRCTGPYHCTHDSNSHAISRGGWYQSGEQAGVFSFSSFGSSSPYTAGDNVNPGIRCTAASIPLPTAAITGQAAIGRNATNYTATATDSVSGISRIDLYVSPTSNENWVWLGGCDNTTTCTKSWTPPASGTYYIVTNATNGAGLACTGNPWGNTCGASSQITVTVRAAVPNPTISPATSLIKSCNSGNIIFVSWNNNEVPILWVDIADNASFDYGYYHKEVSAISKANQPGGVDAPQGFTGCGSVCANKIPGNQELQICAGKTYYVRLFNGTDHSLVTVLAPIPTATPRPWTQTSGGDVHVNR